MPELREGSAENRPLQPPQGTGQVYPDRDPGRAIRIPPAPLRAVCHLPSHFYQQLCNGQKQAARGEQHPQHPAPRLRQRRQAGSWCPVFPVPSWGTGLRQLWDPQQPGTRVQSWGMAGQKGTYVPFPAAKGTVPGAARLLKEGCCHSGCENSGIFTHENKSSAYRSNV